MKKTCSQRIFLSIITALLLFAIASALFSERYFPGVQVFLVNISLFLIVIPLAWLLSRFAYRPLKELLFIARRIYPSRRLEDYSHFSCDDLSEIYSIIKHLGEDRRDAASENSSLKSNMKAFLLFLSEPCALFSPEGILVYCNKAFSELFGAAEAEGRPYYEIVRDSPDMLDEISSSMKSPVSSTAGRELAIGQSSYIIRTLKLQPPGDILLLLADITVSRQLEDIKRELVTNISHELKTPLTSIKGYIETLGEERELAGNRYLQIISRQTDRMGGIINDLLTLSELEHGGLGTAEPVEINGVILEAAEIFNNQMKKKNLQFSLVDRNKEAVVSGDRFRLEAVFLNLLDNAVRYTDRGGITVTTRVKEGFVEIKVMDTGIGIPRRHIPRIFERFYVADKSRSRQTGGTGLGLSIVKQIVLLHNGELNIESEPGEGTEVTVLLPRASSSPLNKAVFP